MSEECASFIGVQRNWVFPENELPFFLPEPECDSKTMSQGLDSVSYPYPSIDRAFDPKSKIHIYILNVPENPRSIDETEGILSDFAQSLDQEGIEPTDLVKRAWKTRE